MNGPHTLTRGLGAVLFLFSFLVFSWWHVGGEVLRAGPSRDCAAATIVYDYSPRRVIVRFTLPRCSLKFDVSSIRVSATLTRSDSFGRVRTRGGKRCRIDRGCALTLDLRHSEIEYADYVAVFRYGRGSNVHPSGRLTQKKTCWSAVSLGECR